MRDAPIKRNDLPFLEVQSIEEGPSIPANGERPECATWYVRGRISDPSIVKLGTWCTLLDLNRECLYGNWLSLPSEAGEVIFDTNRCPAGSTAGARLTYAGQLYGWIAILIEDGPSAWLEQAFESENAIATRFVDSEGKGWRKLEKYEEGKILAPDAKVVEGGWDHEHCSLCNVHIDAGDRFFRHITENGCLCVKCHNQHVQNSDLSFLLVKNSEVDPINGE